MLCFSQRSRLSARAKRRLLCKFAGFGLLLAGAAVWHCSGRIFNASSIGHPTAIRSLRDSTSQAIDAAVVKPDVAQKRARRLGTAVFVDDGHLKIGGCKAEIEGISEDLQCIKDDQMHMIVFYIVGILYMFLSLAIVCDEFFVPALEHFVDEFGISMDVAGATFMAAGGSAPELFTSLIGTFNDSEVGVGTIVGSAVFNVLFVIGVCAVASKEVLTLTWWPLFRDCTYYCLCLIVLSIFFGVRTPYEIELWEAIVLLMMYFGYVLFMKHNAQIHDFIATKFSLDATVERFKENMEDEEKVDSLFAKPSTFRTGIVQLLCQKEDMVETAGVLAVSKVVGNMRETFDKFDKDGSGCIDAAELAELMSHLGCKVEGVNSVNLQLAMQTINCTGTGKISFEEFSRWYIGSEARIEIKMRRIFDKFDANGNGLIDKHEVVSLLSSLGHRCHDEDVDEMIKEIKDATQDPTPESSQSQREGGLKGSSSSKPGNGEIVMNVTTPTNGKMGENEHTNSTTTPDNNTPPSNSPAPDAPSEVVPQEESKTGAPRMMRGTTKADALEDEISLEEFANWYHKSLFYQEKLHLYELEQHAVGGGFSIEVPEDAGYRGLFWYCLTYPVCVALYATLPDVRRANRATVKWAMAEFVGSIGWIGFFSYCMVDWTTILSNTIGIPVPVAGLTILAAGTSVPDLLSSYIVARQGEGDMAVSSSIGSNIFDVTVGLPLPWILYNIIKGQTVGPIKARSLGFSIMVLVMMLVVVIVTVKLCKWRMTKTMGYGMFVFYIFFLTQELLQQFPVGNEIITTPKFD